MSNQKFAIDKRIEFWMKMYGINVTQVLAQADLPRNLFMQKTPSLTCDEYFRFWNKLFEVGDDELLPFKMVKDVTTETFSPQIFASLSSENGLVCLKRISRYKKLIAPILFDVEEKGTKVILTMKRIDKKDFIPSSILTYDLLFIVSLLRKATRHEISPVSFITQNPLQGREYVDYLKIMPEKGSVNQVVFKKKDLELPFYSANEKMWEIFAPELQKQLDKMENDLSVTARVINLLTEMLPSGNVTIESIADKLGFNKRTLQRYLRDENTTFQKELDTTRELLARNYLSQAHTRNEQIAFLLGYDDPNSFVRAFRKWTGMTPSKFKSSF